MPENYKYGQTLMVELQGLEGQGLSIWLEGTARDPGLKADAAVREDITYMRDCVFQSGELNNI